MSRSLWQVQAATDICQLQGRVAGGEGLEDAEPALKRPDLIVGRLAVYEPRASHAQIMKNFFTCVPDLIEPVAAPCQGCRRWRSAIDGLVLAGWPKREVERMELLR